jgi:6-phosphogluconolactonase
MTRRGMLWVLPAAAAVLLFVVSSASASPIAQGSNLGWDHRAQGAVFTATNDPAGNTVLAYEIGHDGSFIPAGNFSTGGTGTGTSLADSGSLVLTADDGWLLVVNAGSNTVSVFRVDPNPGHGALLTLTDQVSSFGTLPVSLAVSGSLVYVLNAGTSSIPGNIFGFYLTHHGQLYPLAGSSQPLSTTASTAPAQISFSPSGTVLVVTEKNTSVLDTYTVGFWGYASGPTVTPSNGATPYGFAFGRHSTLIVSDATPGALSSYHVASSGAVNVVSAAIPDGQTAACWVATIDGGRIAYTSNAHSSTISTYGVDRHGGLTLLTAIAATTAAGDTDLAVVGGWGAQYLLVSDVGTPEIQEFAIGSGASLTLQNAVTGLPTTSEGLAAF